MHTYGGSAVSAAAGSFLFSNATDSRLYISDGSKILPATPGK